MRLRRWQGRLRALAFGALVLGAPAPLGVRAQSPAEPPGEHERVVKIGPQAVVVVDQHGRARMYDDPSQQVRAGCKTNLSCMGRVVLDVVGVITVFGYDDTAGGIVGVERAGGLGAASLGSAPLGSTSLGGLP
jgi:hypothetical protein